MFLQGPVRCVAAGGPWVISGGQDDQLHIYDVQVGVLLLPEQFQACPQF
jgi:hypothetical protein